MNTLNTSIEPKTSAPEFLLKRHLPASREKVWRAFTDPEQMKQWWGHKGATVVGSKMDFRVGGTYLYGLKSPNMPEMWGKFIYLEIAEPEKLVMKQHFSDPEGGITRHPLAPTWPRMLLTVFTFTESGEGTDFEIRWSPIDPTPEEEEIFMKSLESCRGGWSGTLEQLENFLKGAK